MEAIDRRSRMELQVLVAGMHLLRKFGHTIDDILRDGWRIDARVRMQRGDDSPLDQAEGLARGVAGIARFLHQASSDIVVVLGDRIEALAGALAGATTGRVVAHLHGGDIAPGDFDERLRHAITKLAHVHLAATHTAARRIIRMGEPGWRVHVVGAPGLDRLMYWIGRSPRSKRRSGRALIVFHPCGRTPAHERRVMHAALESVRRAGLARTIVYPNSDRGHTGVIEAIETHAARCREPGDVRVVRSMDRDAYLQALIEAEVLVGNSSSGIIEAATAGTPAVNIGPRQSGRERAAKSVVEADESTASIRTALDRALRKRPIMGGSTIYGDGRAGQRVANVLSGVPLDADFRQKAWGA
jgi:UDP-hydrolysing UDP-N-acetyl-D-glucosamine 2-epimerase